MVSALGSSLEAYLTTLSARQRAVAENIANADTPGYRTKDVDFRTELRNVMDGGSPAPSEVAGLRTKGDGNNVSLDREARLLSENALRFNIALNLLRSDLKSVRMAIQEKSL
ncbi:MAG: flagellar biosynthesis protein FlgB [Bryobacterales bacterium]|nr:flagellar biosynthesis protein FlgB [Bryobacterales bacterium]